MRSSLAILLFLFSSHSAFAWSEGGHHLIAVMAFEELTHDQQTAVLEVLRKHPQFEDKFAVPEKVRNPERWLIGRAAFWPDVARKTSYDRPKWHYDIGITGGDIDAFEAFNQSNLASDHMPPGDATLETKELNIKQAVRLCRSVLADKSKPADDRAIALCWICHLVGDSYQPCHSGSFYSKNLFPKGDRGGNEIPTKQGRNLHALWDGLLGPKFDEGDIDRRMRESHEDTETWEEARNRAKTRSGRCPECWLAMSCFLADIPYDRQMEEYILKADAEGTKLERIDLSKEYLAKAGKVARINAAHAACALAAILQEDIVNK